MKTVKKILSCHVTSLKSKVLFFVRSQQGLLFMKFITLGRVGLVSFWGKKVTFLTFLKDINVKIINLGGWVFIKDQTS